MERFKIVDDKCGKVLLETDNGKIAWQFAHEKIKADGNQDIFIEVYTENGFSHWVDSERIVDETEDK